MSIHSSLRGSGGKTGTRRNVLKRHERVRHLMSKGLWDEGRSVFGLPKIKQQKIKARKAAPKEAAAEQAPAAEATSEAAPPAKPTTKPAK